jgi:hypothetical protein
MTRVRRPVIVGVGRGCGARTLAAALHAVHGGMLAPGSAGEADVLVCGSDGQSLRQAAAMACAPSGPRPVLVLTPLVPGAPAFPPPPGFGAVIALPHVRRWVAADARAEAAAVLAYAPERLPPDVRGYAAGLHRIVSALVGSGQLQRAVPPLVSRPAGDAGTSATLWRGLHRPAPVAPPRPVPRTPEPDDEALEGDPVAAGRGR